ncbi:MAG: hypothetical protein V1792_25370, partial [Pseudomonadota bacterium]
SFDSYPEEDLVLVGVDTVARPEPSSRRRPIGAKLKPVGRLGLGFIHNVLKGHRNTLHCECVHVRRPFGTEILFALSPSS